VTILDRARILKELGDTQETTAPRRVRPAVHLPFREVDVPSLVVVNGPEAGTAFALDDERIIGRHPSSDIFLDDITVSRRHAVVSRGDAGYEIGDLGSLNGTYVNAQRVETTVLRPGDEVQIGKFRFVFAV
jgi:pSer/pThr/pTyr-binding forkhead associated (FHA) protein